MGGLAGDGRWQAGDDGDADRRRPGDDEGDRRWAMRAMTGRDTAVGEDGRWAGGRANQADRDDDQAGDDRQAGGAIRR